MSLKELTMQEHRNAERQAFAAVLMSGEINPRTYYFYLLNQHACYSALESHKLFNLFDLRLKRASRIKSDIYEMLEILGTPKENYELEIGMFNPSPSTARYVDYVNNELKLEYDFIAHIYVRYLGDLRGGQMIAKKIPGSGKYYQFENPKELAESIYTKLNDDMAEEAKKVFKFATELFIEMSDVK